MAFSLAAGAGPAPAADEIRCRLTRIDTAQRTWARGANLEQTARDDRYAWLSEVVREEQAAWLATGHTADDQAETVLHRLLRGSGLQGLTAIAPRRQLAQSTASTAELVRPLLTLRRADLLAYLQAHGQTFRLDSSNADPHFTRNRLRHELLPLLTAQYQPAMVDILCRLADQAQAVQAEVRILTEGLLCRAELPRAGSLLIFDLSVLADVSPFLMCEMFRLVWQRERWPTNDMDRRAWLRLPELVGGQLPQHDFPGPIRARRKLGVLQIGSP